MNIGFIGAGKVCHALSFYLKKKHCVKGIYSKFFDDAKDLAEKLETKAYNKLEELVLSSELIFISTNDSQIKEVADTIAELDLDISNKSFAHLSGSLASTELQLLFDRGAKIFSFHPLQSFSDSQIAIQQLANTVFTVEGQGEYEIIVEELLKTYANEYIKISTDNKALYHIAAVILSNYLVTLYGLSEQILKDIGINSKQAQQLLMPLLNSTVNNISEKGFNALTGPLERGDLLTIKHHLKNLKNNLHIEKVYRSLGLETLNLLRGNGRTISEDLLKLFLEDDLNEEHN
ncbi:MAG: DUF2520 domain-containing protein [Fusobacterium sp.]|uniref:Rossmann-like and DUF2520 domain-containing protein n=1 Tax=Fusobacterium sp. TaxID=68766 RepID=UPI0026DA73CD|nr:Rossmann-like and DUF2520 domain-containing protein [Fusobacterium sp.]MDO4690347.1 DUF2520 domain-containing protein [Fusobacterium sp.]